MARQQFIWQIVRKRTSVYLTLLDTKAKVAATAFYELMDRVPNPDSYSQEGEKPIDATASVDLKDVQFSYPQRADIPILRGMSLQVSEHQNIALVGPSGAGKSSVIAMVDWIDMTFS